MFSRNQQGAAGAPPANQPTVIAPPRAPAQAPQAAAPAPSPPPGMDDVAEVVRLSRPLPGHRGEIYEIHLRRPTFGDWIECGDIHKTRVQNPGATEMTLSVDVEAAAVAKWFERLSGLGMAQLARLEMGDARAVFRAVARLVGQLDAGNSATPPSSSGSSAA